jgi:hypothetical protein
MDVKSHIQYQMTEEVVRWRFELELRNSADWWIAFTNPTAGPWKRLMGRNQSGGEGEVYRFPRDEDRPDVVAVNDKLRLVMIVEAKDAAPRLGAVDQVRKSSEVVASLSTALVGLGANPYWGDRANYDVVAGLLWGHPFGDDAVNVPTLFKLYRPHLQEVPLVGFETIQQADGELNIREFSEDKLIFDAPLLA